jgi:hypothetical protein
MENDSEQTNDDFQVENLDQLKRLANGEEELPQATEEPAEEIKAEESEAAEVPAEPVAEVSTSEEPQAYEPNLSYMVKDEKREFDERIKNAVKDKDTEEYIRDLYTKADGLETYKEKLTKRDSEYDDLHGHAQALTTGYQQLQKLRDDQDYLGLEKALGLDEEFIVAWALNRMEEAELPAEEKQALARQRELESRVREQEGRISQFEQSEQARADTASTQRVQDDIAELRSLANSADVKPIAAAMSERGHDFVDAVVSLGNLEFQKTGVEPSVQEVVSKVTEQFRYLSTQQLVTPQGGQQQTQTTQQQSTLPSIDGINQATVDKPVTTMAELKALAESI